MFRNLQDLFDSDASAEGNEDSDSDKEDSEASSKVKGKRKRKCVSDSDSDDNEEEDEARNGDVNQDIAECKVTVKRINGDSDSGNENLNIADEKEEESKLSSDEQKPKRRKIAEDILISPLRKIKRTIVSVELDSD